MMVLVTGPNASGKTTTVRTALAPWARDARVVCIHADDQSGINKSTMPEMTAELERIVGGHQKVTVVEGTNRIALVFGDVMRRAGLAVEANYTETSAAFMRASLMARCASKGKRFRDDYWTERVLNYEARLRYQRLMARLFEGFCPVNLWPVGEGYEGTQALGMHLQTLVRSVVGEPEVVDEEPEAVFRLRS